MRLPLYESSHPPLELILLTIDTQPILLGEGVFEGRAVYHHTVVTRVILIQFAELQGVVSLCEFHPFLVMTVSHYDVSFSVWCFWLYGDERGCVECPDNSVNLNSWELQRENHRPTKVTKQLLRGSGGC